MIWIYIIKQLLRLYLYFYCAIVIHELGHYITARKMGFQDIFLCIGFKGVCGISRGNIFISPIAITGHVSFYEDITVEHSKRSFAIFYSAGVIANLFAYIVGILLNDSYITCINLMSGIFALVPIGRSDGKMIMCLMMENYR